MSPMLSSCNIIGDLGVITLGGTTSVGTLGVDTVIGTLRSAIVGTSLGITFVWGLYGCMLLNNVDNLSMACNFLSPIFKGCFGPVLFIIYISFLATLMAFSFVDNHGIVVL